MLYYRAKIDFSDYKTGYPLIQGELLTKREREKNFPCVSDNAFEIVNISKSLTYISFGVRKQISNVMYEDFYRKCGVE